MNKLERVREQALLTDEEIEVVHIPCNVCSSSGSPSSIWCMRCFAKHQNQAQLDKALKFVRIECDDQSLPENPYNYEDECREFTSYSKGQQDMLKQNWVQVIPKENKE